MSSRLYGVFVSAVALLSLGHAELRPNGARSVKNGVTHIESQAAFPSSAPIPGRYDKTLRFNVYRFNISSVDRGAISELTVKAYRGSLLLTNFRTRIDGAVVGAEVADLDNNRFPELYVYGAGHGGDSFGHVYAWQFLPERKSSIIPVNWRLLTDDSYGGHDSLWIERGTLCRKYPLHQPDEDDVNSTGRTRLVRYRLKSIGRGFALVADQG